MNELDENIASTYRQTNAELVSMVKNSHKMLYRCNIILFVISVILSVTVIISIFMCYRINHEWLEVFNSYEYVTETTTYTQDGNGQNSINNGFMGDMINGTDINNN